MNTKSTIVISAFPACGKSHTFSHFNGKPYTMLDSDSSKYSWIYENGVKTDKRNPNFIADYINHIKENLGKVDCIFVSSHKDVRKALRDNNIPYYMVYPALTMKNEMLTRMKNRGNDEKFIAFQTEHFDEFVTEIIDELETFKNDGYTDCKGIELTMENPYINNIMIDHLINKKLGKI